MARPPTKVRLQKTLKEGMRRCVYRRWEAEVKGSMLLTWTWELERLYRGNTPYPFRPIKKVCRTYPSRPIDWRSFLQAQFGR